MSAPATCSSPSWLACLAGALLGALHAFMSVTLKIDQIIGGTVINILALGLTGYFYTAGLITQGKLQPIPLGSAGRYPPDRTGAVQ